MADRAASRYLGLESSEIVFKSVIGLFFVEIFIFPVIVSIE
jgi:hypothetical protein